MHLFNALKSHWLSRKNICAFSFLLLLCQSLSVCCSTFLNDVQGLEGIDQNQEEKNIEKNQEGKKTNLPKKCILHYNSYKYIFIYKTPSLPYEEYITFSVIYVGLLPESWEFEDISSVPSTEFFWSESSDYVLRIC